MTYTQNDAYIKELNNSAANYLNYSNIEIMQSVLTIKLYTVIIKNTLLNLFSINYDWEAHLLFLCFK